MNIQDKTNEELRQELIELRQEYNSFKVSYGKDITVCKQAEEVLKESEERFRTLFENSTIGIYRTTPGGQILLANPTLFKLLGYSSFEELAGRNLAEDGFDPSYERAHFMDVLKREGEAKGLESAWTKMNGTTLFISESARVIKDKEGKILYYDGIVEDITLRKKAEQELIIANKELVFQNEEKEKRAAELIIANKELAFQNEEKEKRAAELVIANKELAFQNEEKEKRAAELVIANKELAFQNEEKEKRAAELVIANKELAFQNVEKEKRAVELVIVNNELVFQNKKIDEDITIIKQVEVELKESKEQLSNFASNLQVVREEERTNLAREIHDSLAQLLVALKIDLGMFKKKISKTNKTINSEEVIAELEHLMIQVDNINKSARSIINGLRPEQLELLGFMEAAEVHLSSFEQTHKINCSFINTVLDPIIHPDMAIALFRILQESLNNILKHAMATMVKVELSNIADKLLMKISDNGIGFDVNSKYRPDSYGLIGMKERIKLLGGNLDITSKVGEGTMLKVEIDYGK